MNVIGLWDEKVLGKMILSIYGFVIDVFEGKYLAYSIGSFDGTRDDVGGPCVGLEIRDIVTAYDIFLMHLK